MESNFQRKQAEGHQVAGGALDAPARTSGGLGALVSTSWAPRRADSLRGRHSDTELKHSRRRTVSGHLLIKPHLTKKQNVSVSQTMLVWPTLPWFVSTVWFQGRRSLLSGFWPAHKLPWVIAMSRVAEDSVLEWLHFSQGAAHSVTPQLLPSSPSPTVCVLGSGSLGFSCSESYLYLSLWLKWQCDGWQPAHAKTHLVDSQLHS